MIDVEDRTTPYTGPTVTPWVATEPTRYNPRWSVGYAVYRRGREREGPIDGGARYVEDEIDHATIAVALGELVDEWRRHEDRRCEALLLEIGDRLCWS